jgi:predicted nucleotidyltransferase component of viral defense system
LLRGEFIELRKTLNFLGKPNTKQSKDNNTAFYKFDSEISPVIKLKLKVEVNCREHFNVLGYFNIPYEIKSGWYNGKCIINTYQIEELLGTKLRALYQRSKGRDLYDLYKGLISTKINVDLILKCFRIYMEKGGFKIPSKINYINNVEKKVRDKEFLNDITALLIPGESYDYSEAYNLIKEKILDKL